MRKGKMLLKNLGFSAGSYRFQCTRVEGPGTRGEEEKARREVELGFILYLSKELELYLVGSREPMERFKQINYRTRFVF